MSVSFNNTNNPFNAPVQMSPVSLCEIPELHIKPTVTFVSDVGGAF